MLATATSAGDNNDITDSSSSNRTLSVTGDTYAGTFSPYRHGGYSVYMDGDVDWARFNDVGLGSRSGTFTIQGWVYPQSRDTRTGIYSHGHTSGDGNYFSFNIF